jgi:periplasmic protein TonB
MEQPLHTIRTAQPSIFSPARLTALVVSAAIVVLFGWALSVGLIQHAVETGLAELKAQVIPEQLPKKEPPPPPPELKAPPPPFVPPPDIVIQSEAPAQTTAIHTQSQIASAPPISSPVSYGRAHECESEYPAISVRLGEQGVVEVAFTVTTEGSVTDPKLVKSSGSERLDQAALSCVLGWHYKPAIQNGKPVAMANYRANVQYRLQNR